MIEGQKTGRLPRGTIIPEHDHKRVLRRIKDGKIRTDADAAREIARQIEGQHGFWDLEERRKAEAHATAVGVAATEHRKLTQDQMYTEAMNRFGTNPMKWAFVCPSCKDVATGQDFRDALQEHPRQRFGKPLAAVELMGQECIGVTLGVLRGEQVRRGCAWSAYGEVPGPWEIEMPDGHTAWGFPLAHAA